MTTCAYCGREIVKEYYWKAVEPFEEDDLQFVFTCFSNPLFGDLLNSGHAGHVPLEDLIRELLAIAANDVRCL